MGLSHLLGLVVIGDSGTQALQHSVIVEQSIIASPRLLFGDGISLIPNAEFLLVFAELLNALLWRQVRGAAATEKHDEVAELAEIA
jgi:hypothetical protein